MKDYKRMTVGEIVADNFNNAGIFDKYGIDFCCHGSALLPEASKTAGADMEKVIEEIEHLAPTTSENIDFKSWPLDLLVDYILKIHHRNIRTQISVHKVPRLKNCWIKYVAYTVKNIRHSTMCRLSFMIPSPTSMPISRKRNWYCFPTSMRW